MSISSIKIKKSFVSEAIFVDYREHVLSLINPINTHGAVIVGRSKKVIGILDSRSLERDIQRTVIQKNTIVGKLARNMPSLNEKSSILDAIDYMHKLPSKALPYSSKGKIIGIVKRSVILNAILSLGLMKEVKANNIMTIDMVSIDKGATISKAVSLMKKHHINRLIVTDSDKGMGIITNHDITSNAMPGMGRLPKFKTKKTKPTDVLVNELTITKPIIISYNDEVDKAIRDMIKNNTSSVIVERNKKWVGIMTVYDIFEYILLDKKQDTNIHLSGFDETTEEYHTSIEQYANKFMKKVGKLNKVNVESLSLRFKRIKNNKYEVYVRASVKGEGIIHMHMTGFYLERTVDETLSKLKERIIKNMKRLI